MLFAALVSEREKRDFGRSRVPGASGLWPMTPKYEQLPPFRAVCRFLFGVCSPPGVGPPLLSPGSAAAYRYQ